MGVARYELVQKPACAVMALHSGIPKEHSAFWQDFTVEALYTLYTSVTASASVLLAALQEPSDIMVTQKRMFEYLLLFACDLDRDLASRSPRFATGGSCGVSGEFSVAFNALKDTFAGGLVNGCYVMYVVTEPYADHYIFNPSCCVFFLL